MLHPVKSPFVAERIEHILKTRSLGFPREVPVVLMEVALKNHPSTDDARTTLVCGNVEVPFDPMPVGPKFLVFHKTRFFCIKFMLGLNKRFVAAALHQMFMLTNHITRFFVRRITKQCNQHLEFICRLVALFSSCNQVLRQTNYINRPQGKWDNEPCTQFLETFVATHFLWQFVNSFDEFRARTHTTKREFGLSSQGILERTAHD